eukprot:scaffold20736_cov30-Attheya_sp.AAC.1
MKDLLNVALALLLSGSTLASLVTLNEEDIAARHGSIQAGSCEGGFAVTGNGAFMAYNEIDNTFSAHLCELSEAGGGADLPDYVRRVSGKIFNSAEGNEYYYHPHCLYADKEGGVYVGVEIQELTGDSFIIEAETLNKQRKLKTSAKKSKKSKKSKSKSDDGCCRPECIYENKCVPCCCETSGRKLNHAGEEVTSGNNPKGTLAIFYFQREEDHAKDHAGYGISLFHEFDTMCSDFADAVSHAEIKDGKVTEGGFHFEGIL